MMTLRRGFSVIEVSASAVLVLALVSGSLDLIRRTLSIQEESRRDDIAQCEVSNLMETVAIVPWEKLTEDDLSRLALSDTSLDELNDPRLEVRIERTEGGTDGKRVLLRLSWSNPHQHDHRSATELTCWRYRP